MSSLLFWLLVLLALGAVAALGHFARRHAWVGLLSGAGLIGLAIHFWQNTSSSNFRSDGSPAGAVLGVMFLLFELLLVIIGLWFFVIALSGRRTEERREEVRVRADDRREQRPNATRDIAGAGDGGAVSAPNIEPPADPTSLKANVSGGVAVFSALLGLLFLSQVVALLLGRSNRLICGRKSCIDPFGFFSWVNDWGGAGVLALCYLVIACLLLFVAHRGFWPKPKVRRAWLDKYRKPPRNG